MVIQRPEFKGLVLCRELWLFAVPGLDEELDAVEGNKGWPLRDEFVDKLLDRVSPEAGIEAVEDGDGRIVTTCSSTAGA